ncbi:cytidine deaminase [Lutispora sp.]|uniref:cytidine deaminase n=1 Tax=Lutispora sp. TaxID=2828727 RepID=UPI000EE27D7A|nr:cytidine deaminase [Lutispora sp.]MEA4960333.1 cytidine deaminase [Lutispora sp.]HCJ58122.1 cytidine deaminase [Clostridiaceae bacterium]
MSYDFLIEKAKEAREKAYVKYSNFKVGAALLGKSGKIYTGCNIENASYGATICAERTAFTKAISEGEKEFEAIAIVSSSDDITYPCGICRQFMSEFGLDLKLIFTDGHKIVIYKLSDLLPYAFTEFEAIKEV